MTLETFYDPSATNGKRPFTSTIKLHLKTDYDNFFI